MNADPYVEAGARAILRRALFERDINMAAHFPTDRLVAVARLFEADVQKIVGWWEIMASGKPHLTDRQRQIMLAACDRALELFGVPR